MQISKTNKIIISLATLSVLSAGLNATDWLTGAGTERGQEDATVL